MVDEERRLGLSRKQLKDFCGRWKIIAFSLFGSVLRDDYAPGSDIDVLVTFGHDAEWTLLDIIEMEQELSDLVGRPVDLVNRKSVECSENWIRREAILGSEKPVYVAR